MNALARWSLYARLLDFLNFQIVPLNFYDAKKENVNGYEQLRSPKGPT